MKMTERAKSFLQHIFKTDNRTTGMQQLLNNPEAVFVDVRNEWEFEEGHLPNARHIPLEQVALRLPEFREMDGPVILYCRSGNRSGMAVRLLQQAGISNVHNGGGLAYLQNIMLN